MILLWTNAVLGNDEESHKTTYGVNEPFWWRRGLFGSRVRTRTIMEARRSLYQVRGSLTYGAHRAGSIYSGAENEYYIQ